MFVHLTAENTEKKILKLKNILYIYDYNTTDRTTLIKNNTTKEILQLISLKIRGLMSEAGYRMSDN